MKAYEIIIILGFIAFLYILLKPKSKGVENNESAHNKKLEALQSEIEQLKQRALLESATHKLSMETAKRESELRIHEANIQRKRAEESEAQHKEELEKNKKLLSQKKSSEVRVGQIAEQLMPILNDFPYDRKKVRGLFNPIDAIVFEDDEIIFMEFKTGKAQLSQKQRNIKKLVEAGKVRWEERRIEGE